MKIDAIIFDLDGTLWDSSDTISKAWMKIFNDNDLKFDINGDDIKSVMGKTNEEIASIFFKDFSKDKQNEIMNLCSDEELIFIEKLGGNIYKNVIETLKELDKKYKLYIVSNCQRGYIESFLKYYKLEDMFSDNECSGNTNYPKKYNIDLIIKRNNLKYPVYVGDTMGDFESASNNNIPFIYAEYGFGNVSDKNYSIKDIAELPNIVKQIENDEM